MILSLFWKNKDTDKNGNSLDHVEAGIGNIYQISIFSEHFPDTFVFLKQI